MKKLKAVELVSEMGHYGFKTIGWEKGESDFADIFITRNEISNEITLSNESGYFIFEMNEDLWMEIETWCIKRRTYLEIINYWYSLSKRYKVSNFSSDLHKLFDKKD
jgi:hypothetical protein